MKQIKRNTPDDIIKEVVNELVEAEKKEAKKNPVKATDEEIEKVMEYLKA